MKNLKIDLAAIALVLGAGSALAMTGTHRFANKTWGKLPNGTYVNVTGQPYSCTPSAAVCTEDYPSDVNPNNQAGDAHPGIADPVNIVHGAFSN